MTKEICWILNEKYGGIKSADFEKDILRLKNGEPVSYIIGNKPFLNTIINLDEHPLIPREETEYWVEKTFKIIKDNWDGVSTIKCLDIFSGSGCIGIALLKNLEFVTVDFADVVQKNIEQINKNMKLNNIDEQRVNIIKSDVFENITQKYDYIFANPPYISKEKIDEVQKSVLDFEPKEALLADEDGLFFIKKIINESNNYLNGGGKVFVEFGSDQKEEIEEILGNSHFKSEFLKDQYDIWRVFILTKDI